MVDSDVAPGHEKLIWFVGAYRFFAVEVDDGSGWHQVQHDPQVQWPNRPDAITPKKWSWTDPTPTSEHPGRDYRIAAW